LKTGREPTNIYNLASRQFAWSHWGDPPENALREKYRGNEEEGPIYSLKLGDRMRVGRTLSEGKKGSIVKSSKERDVKWSERRGKFGSFIRLVGCRSKERNQRPPKRGDA